MVNSIQRDLRKRKLYSQYEMKRLELKSLVENLNLSKQARYAFMDQLNKLPKNSSRVRFKNRCILTGRGRSVYQFCRLSRISFRQLARQGKIMGVLKSSW